MNWSVLCGDVLERLREMPDESVQCVVTSPPYWGLRDYGTATWEGGAAECDHRIYGHALDKPTPGGRGGSMPMQEVVQRYACRKCGACRIDAQIGLEPTPDAYVAKLVEVFREVRRVLRGDGTLWLNLGDSYASTKEGNTNGLGTSSLGAAKGIGSRIAAVHTGEQVSAANAGRKSTIPPGLKPKDLVGIPWLVARSLQEPYYTGRISRERDRVWLAAMIDGEGTICGFDHERGDDGSHRSGLHLAITNTSMALLDEASRIWPASRSMHQRPHAGHLGTKDSWRWIVHGIENKMAALRELYPYLIVKRQQAIVGYTLLTLMADAKRLGHSSQKDAVLENRRVLTSLLSDLNHDRPVTMPSWLVEPPSLYDSGWYLRSDIIWSKPNPMPESVTDRPTKAHEYVFLLTKSSRYYFDQEAVREDGSGRSSGLRTYKYDNLMGHETKHGFLAVADKEWSLRNIRSVWTIATQPFPEAHFATYPEELVERCVKAGTSERGACPECGAPVERVVEHSNPRLTDSDYVARAATPKMATAGESVRRNDYGTTATGLAKPGWRELPSASSTTTGWRASCDHDSVPTECLVLDPFAGSGTTGVVALKLGRSFVGIELNPTYAEMSRRRIENVSPLLAQELAPTTPAEPDQMGLGL